MMIASGDDDDFIARAVTTRVRRRRGLDDAGATGSGCRTNARDGRALRMRRGAGDDAVARRSAARGRAGAATRAVYKECANLKSTAAEETTEKESYGGLK